MKGEEIEGFDRCREALIKLVADREFRVGERLKMALDLVNGVLEELEESPNPISCVAEGKLEVVRDAIVAAENLLS